MKKTLAKKFWSVAQPILQTEKKGRGRPEFSPKRAFFGILYVLRNGCRWHSLPREFGKPTTVHGKFMKWTREGLIEKIFKTARHDYLEVSDAFNNWVAIDTSSCKASFARCGGKKPTDRGKRGIKKNITVDSRGAPLAVAIAPANQHDSKTLLNPLRQLRDIFKHGYTIIAADSAYHSKELVKMCAKHGFVVHAATNVRRSKGLPIVKPKGRYKVEHTHSWLNNFRGIRICYGKLEESILSFLQLAAAVQLFKMKLFFG